LISMFCIILGTMHEVLEKAGKRYLDIAEELFAEIREGKYSVRHSFPSLTRIMRRFDVARATAAKCVDELKRRGVIKATARSGLDVVFSNRIIGLILPGIAYSEFFSSLLSGISRQCQKEDVGLLFGDVYSVEHEVRVRQAKSLAADYVHKRVAGVIFQPIEFVKNASQINREIVSILTEASIPVVLVDYDIVPPPGRSEFDLVGINNFDAGRRVAEHLVSAGAKHVHFFSQGYGTISVQNRFAGVRSAMGLENGGGNTEVLRIFSADDAKAVFRFLKKHSPDAIVCGNDSDATCLKCILDGLGVRVPEDIMICGFDDSRQARTMNPPLTTVRQPCDDIATSAVRTLLSRISNPTYPVQEILLSAPLVVRGSTCRQATVGSYLSKTTKKRKRKHGESDQ